MKAREEHRIVLQIITAVMAILLFVQAVPVHAQGPYNVTVTYKRVLGSPGSTPITSEEDYQDLVVIYTNAAGDTQLGDQGTVAYTDEGLIKMREFAGWTTVPKSEVQLSADNALYSPGNTLADVFGTNTTGEITLYAYYDGLLSHWTNFFGTNVPYPNQNINKHRWLRLYDGVTNQDDAVAFLGGHKVKEYLPGEPYHNTDPELFFSPDDNGYTAQHKEIIAYYRPIDFSLPMEANFGMNKGVAFVVKNNSDGQISKSEINMTFDLPQGTMAASTLNDLLFESYAFRIKGARAETESGTIELTTSMREATLAFDRFDVSGLPTNQLIHSVTVIAEPKNRGSATGEMDSAVHALLAPEYTQPMRMSFPANGSFILPKELARSLAVSGGTAALSGRVDGIVRHQLYASVPEIPEYILIMLGLPTDLTGLPINNTPSNQITIGFVFPQVTFDKNTIAYGDPAEQIVALDVEAKEEEGATLFVGSLMPDNPAYTDADGTVYRFLGWNTQRDGSGTLFTDRTDVLEDMTVYAQWRPVLPDAQLTYEPNGGTGSPVHETHEQQTDVLLKGSADLGFSRSGYTFAGWNTAADGSGTAYQPGTVIQLTADTILYAQWQPVPPPAPTYPTLEVPLAARKVLKNGVLSAGQFVFELRDAQGKVLAEAVNAADGSIVFPNRTFSLPVQNYTYTITEKAGTDTKVTYDKTVYKVMITTVPDGGKLKATVRVDKDGIPYAGEIIFTNVVPMPKTGDTRLSMSLLLGVMGMFALVGAVMLRRRHPQSE